MAAGIQEEARTIDTALATMAARTLLLCSSLVGRMVIRWGDLHHPALVHPQWLTFRWHRRSTGVTGDCPGHRYICLSVCLSVCLETKRWLMGLVIYQNDGMVLESHGYDSKQWNKSSIWTGAVRWQSFLQLFNHNFGDLHQEVIAWWKFPKFRCYHQLFENHLLAFRAWPHDCLLDLSVCLSVCLNSRRELGQWLVYSSTVLTSSTSCSAAGL